MRESPAFIGLQRVCVCVCGRVKYVCVEQMCAWCV